MVDIATTVLELDSQAEEYKRTVKEYQIGRVSEFEMKKRMYETGQTLNYVNDRLREIHGRIREEVNPIRTTQCAEDLFVSQRLENKDIVEEVTDYGFEVFQRVLDIDYGASATDNELLYQVFEEQYPGDVDLDDSLTRGEQLREMMLELQDTFDYLREDLLDHKRDYLEETLGTTLSRASVDLMTEDLTGAIDEELQESKAEQIRKNPRDSHFGYFNSEKPSDPEEKSPQLRTIKQGDRR